ncbi:MAG TPA: HNH endonuclease [Gaiellaceae bacterium]|nr:HNH endonuclease [Gaiellaceae bacterium]
MRDDDVRSSCFASLDVLCARHGPDVPYRGGLDQGFPFRGARVPFLSPQKGIFRARAQQGPAALSIQTSAKSPYDDEQVESGFLYAYQAGPPEHPDNRALRSAHALAVPLVYFVATRAGWYQPIYPCFVVEDDPAARRVLVSPGEMVGPLDEREPVLVESPIERRYLVRETRVRVHQARFRGRVIPAYRDRCAICRLREARLLDAAHIVGDLEERGEPVVSNGLSLCSIHHRAFDQDLVGISPDYDVRVSERLLEEEDGPMLDLLKAFHRAEIVLPERRAHRPDRERLAERFERFAAAQS